MNNSVTAVSTSAGMISIAPAKSVQCLDSAVPDIGADHGLLYDPVSCENGAPLNRGPPKSPPPPPPPRAHFTGRISTKSFDV